MPLETIFLFNRLRQAEVGVRLYLLKKNDNRLSRRVEGSPQISNRCVGPWYIASNGCIHWGIVPMSCSKQLLANDDDNSRLRPLSLLNLCINFRATNVLTC